MRTRVGVAAFAAVVAAFAAPSVARASLILLKPNPSVAATFIGRGVYPSDGLGQTAAGGTIQAEVPPGSRVVHAYLYGAYYSLQGPVPAGDFVINFDGANITFAKLQTLARGTFELTSARADVTAQVAAKVGGGAGITSFTIGNDPASLNGLGLVVIYSNPRLPTTTIAVLDGAAAVTGDTATFTFTKPVNPAQAGFAASLPLGSGHSNQGEAGHVCGTFKPQAPSLPQSSTVDVNGARLSSCAGSYDDGQNRDGALITVGGVGDVVDNPSNPAQKPGDGSAPRTNDDELYDLRPFLRSGARELQINTANESMDDLVFLAVISVTGEAGVTTGGGQTPTPVVGKSFNASVVSGVVVCRPRGSRRFTRLTKLTQFRMGSECDASRGVIRLTSAAGRPRSIRSAGGRAGTPTQTADFSSGRFLVTQTPAAVPYTDLTLTGGDFARRCGRKKRGVAMVAAADPSVRKVRGRGQGRFRTKGRYSSAEPRGKADWTTEDRCHSTHTKVTKGSAVVTDRVRKKKVIV